MIMAKWAKLNGIEVDTSEEKNLAGKRPAGVEEGKNAHFDSSKGELWHTVKGQS